MALISDLKTITPKYDHRLCRGNIEIHEHGPQATVTKVIWNNSDFNCIDQELVKDATSFFEICKAPEIFRKDCDGIMTFEHNGQKYMFLTELKSGFSTQDLYKAKTQIIASFIKTNMILHMLSSYRLEDYIIKGFIVGHPPKNDFLGSLHQLTSLPGNHQTRLEYSLAMKIFIDHRKSKSISLKPTDFNCIHNLPFGQRGIFPKIELHYIEVPIGQTSITLDATKYV